MIEHRIMLGAAWVREERTATTLWRRTFHWTAATEPGLIVRLVFQPRRPFRLWMNACEHEFQMDEQGRHSIDITKALQTTNVVVVEVPDDSPQQAGKRQSEDESGRGSKSEPWSAVFLDIEEWPQFGPADA